jgi:hypothetical protein
VFAGRICPLLRPACAETTSYQTAERVIHLFSRSIYTCSGVYFTLGVTRENFLRPEGHAGEERIALITQNVRGRKSVWWRVYSWLIAVQIIGAPLSAIYYGQLGWKDVLDWVFIVTGVSGLMGYSFGLHVGKAGFWRVFLPVFVLWDLMLRIVVLKPPQGSDVVFYYAVIGVLFLLLVPQYLAIHRFGRELEADETGRG